LQTLQNAVIIIHTPVGVFWMVASTSRCITGIPHFLHGMVMNIQDPPFCPHGPTLDTDPAPLIIHAWPDLAELTLFNNGKI